MSNETEIKTETKTKSTVEIIANIIKIGTELGKSSEEIERDFMSRLCPGTDETEKLKKIIAAIRKDFECPYSNFRIANARLFEKDGCVLSCDHSQEKRDACWDQYIDEIKQGGD